MAGASNEESHDVGQQSALDPEEILERLKAEHQVLRWGPLPPEEVRQTKQTDYSHTKKSLEYLHQHWAIPDAFDPAASGGGPRGRILSLFGRLTYRVLAPYFREERGLLSHLVRINEALEQRCDDLARRCQQLEEDILDRQVAEAANQAKLALWLHLEAPETANPPANGSSQLGADETPSAS